MSIRIEIKTKLLEQNPGRAVFIALERLLDQDKHLFIADVNERSITHRLGMYLQDEFPEYDVDCEYNRTGIDPKRISDSENTSTDDTDGNTVFPDVIVHDRGGERNYLVIEVKKSNNRIKHVKDIRKLKAYKNDDRLKYEHGLFIVLKVGEQPGVALIQWVD